MFEPVIDIQALRVFAGRRMILDVAELAIPAGEVVAVVGPNGAGKSTLLKTLVGLRRPAAGRVRVLGEAVERLSSGGLCRLRRRMGYLPQLLAAYSQAPLTAREAAVVGRTGIAGLGRRLRKSDWRIVDEWLDRLGLARLAHQAYAELSGGEQRKTLLARAMVQQPDLLLLDEPTANLDLAGREAVVATIQQLHRETHVTVLLVCHELEVLPPSCRRVLLLEAGRLIADGSPREVLRDDRVTRLYGTELRVHNEHGRWAVAPSVGEGEIR